MGWRDSAAELWAELRQQRLRALLSLSGIAWGTLSILLLLAFSVGFEELFEERQRGLGDGVAIAWPSRTTRPWQGLPAGRVVRVTRDDVLALRDVPGMRTASPEFVRYETLAVGETILRVGVSGVDPEFARLRTLSAQLGGRFLNALDLERRRRVMFLGDDLAKKLFDRVDPVGRSVVLNGAPYRVIGVLVPKAQDSDYGSRDEDRAFVPATTFSDVYGDRFVDNFVFRAEDASRQDECTMRVVQALATRLRFDPRDRDALSVWDTTEEQRMVGAIFLAFHIVLGIAGVFTLLAGGVGVANLMYLMIRRRTAEIGLKLAVGARPTQIRREVMLQTVFLVAMGGIVGAGLAVLAVEGAAAGPWVADVGVPRIPWVIGLGATLLLASMALFAGYFPARDAARLDPVEALRS